MNTWIDDTTSDSNESQEEQDARLEEAVDSHIYGANISIRTHSRHHLRLSLRSIATLSLKRPESEASRGIYAIDQVLIPLGEQTRGDGKLWAMFRDERLIQSSTIQTDSSDNSSALGGSIGLTNTSLPTAQTRRAIPTQPFATTDVLGMKDDFYSQLISWSSKDMIAVSHLGGIMLWDGGSPDRETSYLYKNDTDRVHDTSVNAIEFSNGGGILAVGSWSGRISIWDIETRTEIREIVPDRSILGNQIQSLSWSQSILTSGGDDGEISHFDVRCGRAKVGGFQGHTEGVCGLKWRDDGKLLVSGCNGGSLNLWDSSRIGSTSSPRVHLDQLWSSHCYIAAVKALAWCPENPSLLASGGGRQDPRVSIWNVSGECLTTRLTPAQITSIQWSKHYPELLTTHSDPVDGLIMYDSQSLGEITQLSSAHSGRVLWSAIGPRGDMVCTGAADKTVKIWKLWG